MGRSATQPEQDRPAAAEQLPEGQSRDDPDHRFTRYAKTSSSDSSVGRSSRSVTPQERAIVGIARANAPSWDVRTVRSAVAQLHAEDALVGDEGSGEPPVVGRPKGERVRPIGHQTTDLAEVAGCGEPAADDHEHTLGEPLDLFEDVRREDDGAPVGGEPPEEIDHVEALPRIGPVERLVEQQHSGIVDEGSSDLDPLLHPLGVPTGRPVCRVLEIDQRESPLGPPRRRRRGPAAAR